MNAQERRLLVQFLDQLTAAQAAGKDAEADALIKAACARQPDACYLLVQRALQLEQAFDITQAELDRLQAQSGQSREAGSFLGGDGNAWGRSSATTTPSGAPVSRAAPAVSGPSAGSAAAQPPQRFASGMLGNVAATAAGVVAGSFLFQGVQNLLGRQATDAPWSGAGAPTGTHDPATLADATGDVPDEGQDVSSWDDGGDGGDFA